MPPTSTPPPPDPEQRPAAASPLAPTASPWSKTAGAVSAIVGNWFVSWIVIPVAIVVVLHYLVFSAYHVVGTSMIPTLQNSNYLIVSKVDHTLADGTHRDYIPSRDQVIVFHYPKQPTLDFVKRVIGLPGDRVVVKNCAVTVYNQQHPSGLNPDSNHQIEGSCTDTDVDETIPQGNVFVLGDNRTPNGSFDSRDWGLLPSSDIIGNVVLRLYPVNELKIF